jgi:hypothetical protein
LKLIERGKGANHDKVKEKSTRQLVVKEEKGGRMVANNKGQHGQARKRVKEREKRKIGDKRGRGCHLNLEET